MSYDAHRRLNSNRRWRDRESVAVQ
jgi:hypothetical protein